MLKITLDFDIIQYLYEHAHGHSGIYRSMLMGKLDSDQYIYECAGEYTGF